METATNNSSAGEFNTVVWQCMRHKLLCDVSLPPRPANIFTHYTINIVLNVLLAIVILGNSLIFAAYYQNYSLRTPANTILLSLAVTDFLCGATSQPLCICDQLLMMARGCTTVVCTVMKMEMFFMLFLIGATILNLSATTVDRYIAVCHSFKYLELVTNSRVRTFLAGIWVSWFIISFSGVMLRKIEILFIIVLSSNIILISVLYVMIFREIRRIKANEAPMPNNQQQEREAEERRGAKTVAIILGLLILSFIPLIVHGILSVTRLGSYMGHIRIYASTAALSNSSFNVFVYYWRNEQMRKAMIKVIRKITSRCTNQVNPY